MKVLSYMALTAALYIGCSCAVKEDREFCPSRLTVDASSFFGISDVAYVNMDSGTGQLKDTLYLKTGQTSAEWLAPKGMITAYAFSNLTESIENEGIITIPTGKDADPLRAFCQRLECYNEIAGIEAVPNRQSAKVRLRILNVEDGYPYSLQIIGDVCGIDLRSMTPVQGEFRYDLCLDDDLTCDFYLPRQNERNSLEIKVLLDGVHIETLPLAAWIEAAGYDWTMDDLPDISLDMDHARMRVVINVQGWEHESYEVVL